MTKKHTRFVAMLAGTLLLGTGAFAQNADAEIDHDIQMLRKDVRSAKKQIIAANLELTDTEAERFWPLYDQFAAELTKINDTKLALLKDYGRNSGAITSEQADRYLQTRAAAEHAAIRLRLKYIPAFRKVLPAKATALFYQIEWRLNLLVDLQLSQQIPLIEQ